MFDFIKFIDFKMIAIVSQLESDIEGKSGNTIVTIQTYLEQLLKNIDHRETGEKSKGKQIGAYLSDDFFCDTLLNDFHIDINKVSLINKKANSTKHDGNYDFDSDEIKEYIDFMFYASKNVFDYYYDDVEYEIKYDENYYSNLLNRREEEKEQIKEYYDNEINNRVIEYKSKLDELINEKKILEDRLIETEKEKDSYKEKINEQKDLENKSMLVDKEITKLRQEKAKIESKLNEEDIANKKELDEEIRKLKASNYELRKQIENLKLNDIIDPSVKMDRDNSILEEKNREIEELKSLIENQEIVKNDIAYKSYRRNSMKIGFSSSYTDYDSLFIISGVNKKVSSTSKYKSFYAVVNNLLQRGNKVSQSSYLKEKDLTDEELNIVYRLEMAILSLIRNNKLKDDKWFINYMYGSDIIKFAIEDIFYYMNLITGISKTKYVEPELIIKYSDYDSNYNNIKYDNKFSYDYNIYNIVDVISDNENDNNYFNIWIDDYINYNVSDFNKDILRKILKELFGFDDFNEGQFDILPHTLNGNNTIGILPTGGGKSLIYQLSSLLEPKISIVVDPINSLIKDQIDGLKNKYGITRCLNLTSSNENRFEDEKKLLRANAMFAFLSPERFQIEGFRKILTVLSYNHSVERIVLDEVHCLSEWGHDFRIPYLMLADTLRSYCGDNIKYLGLTATAAASVIDDLVVELGMKKEDVKYLKHLRRKNLTFHFNEYRNQNDMTNSLISEIENNKTILNGKDTNCMIIFSRTKGGLSFTSVDNTYSKLEYLYPDRVTCYHGKLESSAKEKIQDEFVNNNKSILIATKAFGMGIDKPNIRCTIHYGIPMSFESFYQEAGRAGRDNKPANCYVYTYSRKPEEEQSVSEFFNDDVDVNNMKAINSKLRWADINTNLFFFTSDLKTPREEASEIYSLYRAIINSNNNILLDDSFWNKEKMLYVLHKIGIVTNWEKDFSNYTLTFHLSSYCNDMDYIKGEAFRYVSQYENYKETYEKFKDFETIDKLEELIYILRNWYFKKFILGRKNQLYNMIDKINKFANRDCSDEIQKEIDSYFDLTNILFETDSGYSLRFENDSFSNIIEYISEIDESIIDDRKIEMERVLESITTPNISLYTSLLFLIKGPFDSRNGKQRFENVYKGAKEEDKVDIMVSLAELLYPKLNDDNKKILLDALYHLDYGLMRRVFLEHVKEDNLNKVYWLSYINDRINKILYGGKK